MGTASSAPAASMRCVRLLDRTRWRRSWPPCRAGTRAQRADRLFARGVRVHRVVHQHHVGPLARRRPRPRRRRARRTAALDPALHTRAPRRTSTSSKTRLASPLRPALQSTPPVVAPWSAELRRREHGLEQLIDLADHARARVVRVDRRSATLISLRFLSCENSWMSESSLARGEQLADEAELGEQIVEADLAGR